MQVRVGPLDSRTLDEQAILFHQNSAPDAVKVWNDGLQICLAGLEPFAGHVVTREEEPILLTLLSIALQHLLCSFDLALRGYYPQALNLLRSPAEHWLAYWYLRSFPGEHARFHDVSRETPRFENMLRAIEKHHNRPRHDMPREWFRGLHRFSHVDRYGVRLMLDRVEDGLQLRLGPQQDLDLFRGCAGYAVAALIPLLEALDNLRQLVGYGPLPVWREYVDQTIDWISKNKESGPNR